MKTLRKSLKLAALASVFFGMGVGLTSCSEEDGEKCLECAKLVQERAGFEKVKFAILSVNPNQQDFRSYYDGSYFFTVDGKTDTAVYFVTNPEMFGEYKADSSYSFTANVYNTTDVLLQNNYNGKFSYYEIVILEMGTKNAASSGGTGGSNTGGSTGGNTGGGSGDTGGGSGSGNNPGGDTGGGTGGGGTNPGGGGLNPGGGGLNPGGGGLNPGGGL